MLSRPRLSFIDIILANYKHANLCKEKAGQFYFLQSFRGILLSTYVLKSGTVGKYVTIITVVQQLVDFCVMIEC